MPDPLYTLPNELWNLCIEFAIAGRSNGPLDFLMVSTRWRWFLLSSPNLWTRISIHNGEDEMARISAFLYLSKQSPLYVDVMTGLPTLDSLRLVAEHISRVRTILIRPGASDDVTALHTRQWTIAASRVLATLSNGIQLCDVESPFCFGISLLDDGQSYFHVILLQLTVTAGAASKDEPNHMWEERIAKAIPAPEDQDSLARTASISSIDDLASYAQFHDAISATIPSLVKLLEGEEARLRLEIVQVIGELGNRVEFRKAIASTMPSLIKLLEGEEARVRLEIVQVIGELRNHIEFREAVATTIPSLIKLLEDKVYRIRVISFELISKLADHADFHEAIASTFPLLIEILEGEVYEVRALTVKLIGKFANRVELHEAIATTIPSLIKLVEDYHPEVRKDTVDVLGELANYPELHEAIAPTIPSLLKLLDYNLYSPVFRLIGKLKKSGDVVVTGLYGEVTHFLPFCSLAARIDS